MKRELAKDEEAWDANPRRPFLGTLCNSAFPYLFWLLSFGMACLSGMPVFSASLLLPGPGQRLPLARSLAQSFPSALSSSFSVFPWLATLFVYARSTIPLPSGSFTRLQCLVPAPTPSTHSLNPHIFGFSLSLVFPSSL